MFSSDYLRFNVVISSSHRCLGSPHIRHQFRVGKGILVDANFIECDPAHTRVIFVSSRESGSKMGDRSVQGLQDAEEADTLN
jgi:hypothetical protein